MKKLAPLVFLLALTSCGPQSGADACDDLRELWAESADAEYPDIADGVRQISTRDQQLASYLDDHQETLDAIERRGEEQAAPAMHSLVNLCNEEYGVDLAP